jgi:hypothetical protein
VKQFFIFFALVAILLAAYPFLIPDENSDTLDGLPWQIEVQADGSTQVFGLHIGVSRLSDVTMTLGSDYELAIISATSVVAGDDPGNLEMYYGHYRAGLLSGKLVLQVNSSALNIQHWRDSAIKSEYMASGLAKKYNLSDEDLPDILNEVVTGITFIPAVNLDEKVILERFGMPAQVVHAADVTHYLYPQLGLDIALHEKSKEVLQYVAPDKFTRLIEPL